MGDPAAAPKEPRHPRAAANETSVAFDAEAAAAADLSGRTPVGCLR